MGLHNVYDALRRGSFPSGLAADPQSGPVANAIAQMFPTQSNIDKRTGYMFAYGDTVPSGVAGYAAGCTFFQVNPAAGVQSILVNTGTVTSCTFTKITDIEDVVICSVPIAFLATNTITTLFVARSAWKVTAIDYVGDVQDGAAITATVVKATGTNAPSAGTTPQTASGGVKIGTGGTANTVQPQTLTTTAADLLLAAGDRIAIVLSGAGTAWHGVVTIKGIRQ